MVEIFLWTQTFLSETFLGCGRSRPPLSLCYGQSSWSHLLAALVLNILTFLLILRLHLSWFLWKNLSFQGHPSHFLSLPGRQVASQNSMISHLTGAWKIWQILSWSEWIYSRNPSGIEWTASLTVLTLPTLWIGQQSGETLAEFP